MAQKEVPNPYVTTPISLGGLLVGIIAIFAIFSSGNLSYVIPIAWSFVALGGIAIFFAYLSSKKKK